MKKEKVYGSKRRKVIAILTAVLALGTFTLTAAATDMFGMTATRKGAYGLNVKVENSEIRETGLTIVLRMSISMHIVLIPMITPTS